MHTIKKDNKEKEIREKKVRLKNEINTCKWLNKRESFKDKKNKKT